MKDKAKKSAVEAKNTVTRVVGNAEHLVLAVALVVCAGYNYYDLTIREVGNVEYYARLVASVVIALKGAIEIFNFFNKEK